MTPLKAIRAKCFSCSGDSYKEIKLCPVQKCPLHALRHGKAVKGSRPLKAIRAKCYSCGEGTAKDIRECDLDCCPLHAYRFGKRPETVGAESEVETT